MLYDDPAELSWYVMPIATPIRRALGQDPQPGTVVAAVAAVGQTLAALAAEEIWHRDIKPDNLFYLDHQWLIGDFGLVTYPQKEPVTQHGRKLGPIDYMAPEMRADADTALAGPADVWALSKTLWVLLTSADLPQPGPHRASDPAYALRERISYGRVGELDLLLERATQINPEIRESMAGFARELHACLAPPPEITASSTLPQLQERIAALTTSEFERVSQSQDLTRRVDKVYSALADLLDGVYDALGELLPTFRGDRQYTAQWPDLLKSADAGSEAQWGTWSQSRRLSSPDAAARARVTLTIAAQVWQPSGPADIAAELTIEHWYEGLVDVRTIWAERYTAPIGSAQQAQAIDVIRTGFHNAYEDALRWIAQILAGRPVVTDRADGTRVLEVIPENLDFPDPATDLNY
jgi:hypothetical protein